MIVRERISLPSKHFYKNNLNIIVYENIFDDSYYQKLKKSVLSLFENNTLTYKTHRTNFTFNNENFKIVSHAQNAREQQVIYDITFESDYFFQTKYTIKSWSENFLRNNLNPVFYKFLHFFERQEPFNKEPQCWIPIRWHSNIVAYSNFLGLHFDMGNYIFNTHSTHEAKAVSLTFYLFDHEEGMGGEFWSENGFVYKPKQNTAICVNGNSILHGVTENINKDNSKKNPRLAFTTRWAHIDDLYLPGHPDKCLYKLDF